MIDKDIRFYYCECGAVLRMIFKDIFNGKCPKCDRKMVERPQVIIKGVG